MCPALFTELLKKLCFPESFTLYLVTYKNKQAFVGSTQSVMEHNARHIILKVENIYSIHHLEANACISHLGRLFRDSWVVRLWVSVYSGGQWKLLITDQNRKV